MLIAAALTKTRELSDIASAIEDGMDAKELTKDPGKGTSYALHVHDTCYCHSHLHAARYYTDVSITERVSHWMSTTILAAFRRARLDDLRSVQLHNTCVRRPESRS